MNLPKIRSYGEYESDNYGLNTIVVDLGKIDLFYSYKTIVAFSDKDGFKICENVWGTTTGKHLNWLDNGDKKARMKYDDFQVALEKALVEAGFCV